MTWEFVDPIDMRASVARYTRWGPDRVTVVDDDALYRVAADGHPFRVRQLTPTSLEVSGDGDLDVALAEVQYRFADHLDIGDVADLGRRIPAVASGLERMTGYRPPLNAAVLESLISSISAQQVNLQWAATTRARLVERYGTRHRIDDVTVYAFPSPSVLASADLAEIRSMQFTTRKAEYIVEAARAVADGELDGLAELDDDSVIDRVTAVRGLGRWTAEWFLARTLGRPHAVAPGDLGVRKAVSRFVAASEDTLPESEVRDICADWGDGANWGMHLLLEGLSSPASE